MTAMSVAQRMTADELLRMPQDPSGPTSQLIDGEVVLNEPLPRHQIVQRDLLLAGFALPIAQPFAE